MSDLIFMLTELLTDEQEERCAYGTREGDGRTCDCEFEMTGCPELRSAIWVLRNS